jgi:hypothetical protein
MHGSQGWEDYSPATASYEYLGMVPEDKATGRPHKLVHVLKCDFLNHKDVEVFATISTKSHRTDTSYSLP